MLDDDAYQWFDDHGGLTRANGDRFRRMILSRGKLKIFGHVHGMARQGPRSMP